MNNLNQFKIKSNQTDLNFYCLNNNQYKKEKNFIDEFLKEKTLLNKMKLSQNIEKNIDYNYENESESFNNKNTFLTSFENSIKNNNNNNNNNNKSKEKIVNINENLIFQITNEIKKYEIIKKKPKNNKNFMIFKNNNNNNNNFINFNNEINNNDYFQTSERYKKKSLENFDKNISNKKNLVIKNLPFIIKCMNKNFKTIFNKEFNNFKADYNNKYKKNYVNLNQILIYQNMYQRNGVSNKEIKKFYYVKNIMKNKKKFKKFDDLNDKEKNDYYSFKNKNFNNDFNDFDNKNYENEINFIILGKKYEN
jgi:hypothetical protein